MAINVSVLQYDGGLFPDIILLTQCYYCRGTGLKWHKDVLSLQPMIPPTNKRFDIFPPVCVGCSEGLDAFRFFFKHDKRPIASPRAKLGKVCSCC